MSEAQQQWSTDLPSLLGVGAVRNCFFNGKGFLLSIQVIRDVLTVERIEVHGHSEVEGNVDVLVESV